MSFEAKPSCAFTGWALTSLSQELKARTSYKRVYDHYPEML